MKMAPVKVIVVTVTVVLFLLSLVEEGNIVLISVCDDIKLVLI